VTACVCAGEEEDDATTGDRLQQQACEKSSSTTFAIWFIISELLAIDKHLSGDAVSNCQFHLVYLFSTVAIFTPSKEN